MSYLLNQPADGQVSVHHLLINCSTVAAVVTTGAALAVDNASSEQLTTNMAATNLR